MKILITGGCGFIGSHFVEHLIKNTDWQIFVIDKLTYAAEGFDRLRDVNCFDNKRIQIFTCDLTREIPVGIVREIGQVDYIVHMAAETHVDRSIDDPEPFVRSNVLGTMHLLNYARHYQDNLRKFLYFSCYDEKTKAFTKDGAKLYQDLKEGDIVFTLNPETRKLEEQPIEKVIIQDYSGEMIKFSNNIIDLLTTPNHRMYQSDMNVLEAKECLGKKSTFPVSTGFIGGKNISKDLMYLIGIFLGDGFTAYQEKKIKSKSGLTKMDRDKLAKNPKTGRFIKTGIIGKNEYTVLKSWRIFLDIPEKDKARKKTERVLKNLGIKYTTQKGKAGEHLYFTSEEWSKFFNQFGQGAKNKFIPKEFLEEDSENLKELFNGLVDSDGYWGTKNFTTISDKLADNFCELAIKIGYIPNKQKRYSESIFKNRIIKGHSWDVHFANQRKTIKSGYITKEDYQGKVWCIKVKNKNFLVMRNGKFAFSGNTDEVFGPAPSGTAYKEWDRYNSTNPYSASKAGGEELCLAYSNTYKIPMLITHTMNVFGERQHPEKFIPMTIRKILAGEKVVIHANKNKTKAGSRFYIHARNVAGAILFLLKNIKEDKIVSGTAAGDFIYQKEQIRDKFNIVGELEVDNLELAEMIAGILGRELIYEMVDFHSQRPGHDLRYALCGNKLREMGWVFPINFRGSLEKTIRWSLENKRWLGIS